MPTLNLTQATKLYYGNTEVQKLYKGSQQLYPPLVPNDAPIWINSQNVNSSGELVSQFNALRTIPLIATSQATLISNDINGLPSVSFTSGNNYNFTSQSLSNFSLFAVVMFNSTAQQYLVDSSNNIFGLDNISNTYRIMNTYFPTGLTQTQLLNLWHLVEVHRNSGVLTLLINGVVQSTLSLATTWSINKMGTGTSSRNFRGKVAELVIGNRCFTTTEQTTLRSHLLSKYNL